MEFKDYFNSSISIGDDLVLGDLIRVCPYYDGLYYFDKETLTKIRDHLNKILGEGKEDDANFPDTL